MFSKEMKILNYRGKINKGATFPLIGINCDFLFKDSFYELAFICPILSLFVVLPE